MKSESRLDAMDRIKLGTPMLGEIWLKYQVAVFCAHAVDAAVRRIVAGPVARDRRRIDAEPTDVARHSNPRLAACAKGRAWREAWKRRRCSREMSVEMIEVGESTGALPAMLNSISEFYEEDVQNALATAMALIEPIILIVMGVVVAFVLISLYLPIFSIGAGGYIK